jgi:hypothetical protein
VNGRPTISEQADKCLRNMPRFERRITEEQVAAARKKIAAGASLRSAAADVPCAPSTLSARITQAEVAEREALELAGIGKRGRLQSRRDREKIEAGDGVRGPVEVLRGALLATRPSGQPDWPTRVTAARALAQLRPELVEPTRNERPPLVVYDLPAGAIPVFHRPQPTVQQERPNAPASIPPHPESHPTEYELPLSRGLYLFYDDERGRVLQLAEVDVDPDEEVVAMHILRSGDEARDVYRAVGGDLAQLEALFAADTDA